jgi:hypothetical protein
LIAALITDRSLDVRSVERMRLSKLVKYAMMFAELDDYREKNRPRK